MDFGYLENQGKLHVQHLLGKFGGFVVRDWHHKILLLGRALRVLEEIVMVEAIQEELSTLKPNRKGSQQRAELPQPWSWQFHSVESGFFFVEADEWILHATDNGDQKEVRKGKKRNLTIILGWMVQLQVFVFSCGLIITEIFRIWCII